MHQARFRVRPCFGTTACLALAMAVWCLAATPIALGQGLVGQGLVGQELAGRATDRLSVTQWVAADGGGQITVHVVVPTLGGHTKALTGARVRLLGGNGAVHESLTGKDGTTTFRDVPAGVYAIVAQSDDAFACYSIHVVDSGDEASELYPSAATISCGLESKEHFSDAVDGYFPLAYELEHLKLESSRLEGIVDHVRGDELFRVTRVDDSMVGHIYQSSDHGITIDGLDREGRLDPAERANVFLYQNGKRIRHQITDRAGRFQFNNLEVGIYSLISVGPDGIGAVGFELVDPISLSHIGDTEGYQFVSKRHRRRCEFALQVVPCCEPVAIVQESCCEPIACCEPVECCEPEPCCEEAAPVAAAPAAPAGAAAPVGGAGGGAGGAGGAPIGGLAAAGVITAALITNTSDDPPYSPPHAASPDTQRP